MSKLPRRADSDTVVSERYVDIDASVQRVWMYHGRALFIAGSPFAVTFVYRYVGENSIAPVCLLADGEGAARIAGERMYPPLR